MSGIFPTMGKLCFYARDLKILKCVPVRTHSHVWIFTTIIRLGNRMIQPHYYHSTAGAIVVVRLFPIDEFSWGNERENTHFCFPRTFADIYWYIWYAADSSINLRRELRRRAYEMICKVACTKQRKEKATTNGAPATYKLDSSQIATQQNASYRTHILFVQ